MTGSLRGSSLPNPDSGCCRLGNTQEQLLGLRSSQPKGSWGGGQSQVCT